MKNKSFLKKATLPLRIGASSLGLYGVAFFAFGLITMPDDYDEYRVADNLHDYFNYIADQKLGEGSPVNRVLPYQVAMETLGYETGECGADGIAGFDTRQATLAFQSDYNIPQSGLADIQTQQAVYNAVLQSDEARSEAYERLIAPYQTEDVTDFMDKLDRSFAWYAPLMAALRPDVLAHSFIRGVYFYQNMDDPANAVFADCASNHQRDAFRHARMSYEFAKTGGYRAAEAIINNREFMSLNPLPEMFMDLYNHRAAINVAKNSSLKERFENNSQDVLVQKMEEGAFILYPFPLIPKDYNAPREP